MQKRLPILILFAFLFIAGIAGCSRPPCIPPGDAAAGRVAFEAAGCHTCHAVMGEDFPEPTAEPPVPVVLGSPTDPKSREYLAESIIAPSHRFAKPRAVYSGDPPLVLEEREYENIKEGELSRMGNFSESLTVREWLDIVEYLEKMQKRSLPLQ